MRFIRFAMLTLAVALVTTAAPAAGDLAPMQIVTDPVNDHPVWGDPTPEPFDLVAVHIAETEKTVDVIWEYKDVPGANGQGIPEGLLSYFEFNLDGAIFSLRARPVYPARLGVHAHCDVPGVPVFGTCTGVGPGGGSLQGNCTRVENIISCKPVPGAVVDVSVDDAANTITAKMRRLDLRDADDNFLAVDGALLAEEVVFIGIATCQGAVLVSAANCDEGDMDLDSYMLGTPRAA